MATTSCFNTKNFFSEVPKKLVNSENNENLIINCENKNLIFEVFRLTLEYFWRSFNYILPDTGLCNHFN